MRAVFAGILLFGACIDQPETTPDASLSSELGQTTWVSDCTLSSVSTFMFSQATEDNTYVYRRYYDDKCSRMRATIRYSFARRTKWYGPGGDLDVVIQDMTIALNSQAEVDWANDSQLAGLADWTLDEPRSVLGLRLSLETSIINAGDTWLGIYRIKNGELQLSSDLQADAPRPLDWRDALTLKPFYYY